MTILVMLPDMQRVSGRIKWFNHERVCESGNPERYLYPRLGGRGVEGPRPDPCVWVGLFNRRDAEQRMREEIKEADESGYTDAYASLMRTIVDGPKSTIFLC